MDTRQTVPRSAFLGALLAAGWLLAACASPPSADGIVLAQEIENAKTRADHEQLAGSYRRQEAQVRDTVLWHRKMGDKYASWGGDGRSSWGSGMASHCKNLVERYERAADEYAALARRHQELAAQAP